MKILVTGGAGFIGSHLVDRLIKEKHKVVVIDNLSTGKKENINKKAKFYKIDILSSKISQIFKKEKPEIVFHFAAQVNLRESVRDPIKDAKINILGSLNILENCKKFKVKKIIFASSGGAIYGEAKKIPTPENYLPNPKSPYGISKLTIEKYLQFYKENFNLEYLSLRFSNVYGPRQDPKSGAGVVTIFITKLLNNKKATIFGSGSQTRDFLWVEDAVEAGIVAMKSLPKKYPIYNVGTGKEIEINKLYQISCELLRKNIKPIYREKRAGEIERSCLDISKIKKELNWRPTLSLKEGLKKIALSFSKNLP